MTYPEYLNENNAPDGLDELTPLDELEALDDEENEDVLDPTVNADDESITPLDISKSKKNKNEDETGDTAPKKKSVAPKKKSSKTAGKDTKPSNPDGLKTQFISILFWLLAFLTAVFFIANIWSDAGPLIEGYATLLYGLFGWGGLFTVCLFMLYGVEYKRYLTEGTALSNSLTAVGMLTVLSSLFHVLMIMVGNLEEPAFLDAFRFASHWYTDRTVVGGGVIGGFFGSIFYSLMHGWVSVLIFLLILAALVLFYLRLTPEKIADLCIKTADARKKRKEELRELRRVAEKILTDEKNPPATEASEQTTSATVTVSTYTNPVTVTVAPSDTKEPPVTPTPPVTPVIPEETPADTVDEVKTKLPPITVFHPEEVEEEKDTLRLEFDAIPDEDEEDELSDTDFGYGIDEEDELDLTVLTKTPKDTAELQDVSDVTLDDSVFFNNDTLNALDELIDMDEEEEEEEEEDDTISVMIGGEATTVREKPAYTFPPIELLAKGDTSEKTDNREELLANGQKLVDVLKSFRVDTEIVNIACGPTVTRYELTPKSGVRVRAIANLVDDIALNLETSGVRIEAPIPGKAAVGVEVPNKEAATVYLRDLIESEAFRNAKSKLTACVGMDVSGAPILMDIAKMPHLLIAGATGMGKSVGVNSIIMSLLYKATPDELKLILVDPKKVELNMYNKLPHLLIPVVNNPKKAAGALATAVNEMERRFELIESVGARNIKGYNKLIENDPTKEQLPSIVIIIDELADLMMTAKDDVEDSICRIAQKARAAGIHLIICTQRPSVDVITGLIKANVPSRIAFTVASNIDSRTIIDVAGAEKLIGRGDMLFAPVGAMKPIRVQGAFVDDKEVEEVTNFIKNQSTDVQYDDSFLNQVEIEAERCGQQKKKVAADEIDADDDLDPKFYEAVELAVEMGKISTSLLQRKLSLGYGRAAKIIDSMEAMGIVGAPDGQKPRNCLITRQEYQEMMMRQDDPQ